MEKKSLNDKNLIVLFDQHAVHERIRLENIVESNHEISSDGRKVIKSSTITPFMELNLPTNEIRLMIAYSQRFTDVGIKFIQVCLFTVKSNIIKIKKFQYLKTNIYY